MMQRIPNKFIIILILAFVTIKLNAWEINVKNNITSSPDGYSVVLDKAAYDAKNGSKVVWDKACQEVWPANQFFNGLTRDFDNPPWAYMGYSVNLKKGTEKKYLGWFGFTVYGTNSRKPDAIVYDSVSGFNSKGGDPSFKLSNVSLSYHQDTSSFTVDGSAEKIATDGPFPNTPPATPAVFPGGSKQIILTVQGTNIVDNNGNKIILKGFSRPGLEWQETGVNLSPQDIANMKKWNCNVVRISLNQVFWAKSAPATTLGSYKQIVDAMISECIKNKMSVILDLHWTDEGNAINGQTPMADTKSIDFWTNIASTYKNFGTVIFELYNEPFEISKDTWLNGGPYDGTQPKFKGKIYVGYKQLIDAVRKAGATNLCIVNGLNWGYDLSFVGTNNGKYLIQDSNVIYGSHPYSYKGLSHTHKGVDAPLFSENFPGVLNKYPIIFTEWGGDSDNLWLDHGMYSSYLKYINDNNINYSGWAWMCIPGQPGFPCLIKAWDGTPLNGGVEIQKDMQSKPGNVIGGGGRL